MFHFDPCNRLATIHQRYRQTDRTGQRSDSTGRTVFGVCYQTVVCLSVLSVTLVYCGQMVGWRRGVVASVVRRMNEITLRRARLVLGWVTIFGWACHHGM